jgi:cell shape-determining protein MreD
MPADAAKAAGLLFLVVVVQLSVMANVDILGGHPNLLLVTVVCVSLLLGAVFGAVAGFSAYWTGRYGETTGRDRAHAPLLSIAVITILYQVAALVLRYMLGEPAPGSDILAALLPTVLLNLILTIPVYALTRRLLRPPERLTREVRLLG